MCGIVGYTGYKQAMPYIIDGLSKLEYRGYDSAGLAVSDEENKIHILKAKGRLAALVEKTEKETSVSGTCAIGHTRWATHGEPSEENAHPHTSNDGSVTAVHNGIIENYVELKNKLISKGYTFYSQTDTEAVVNLIDYYYKKYKVGPIDAIAKTMVRVRGSYALAIMFKDYPGEIFTARKDSPMIIGVKDGEAFIASDVPAILSHTRNVYYMDNLEMAHLTKDGAVFYNLNGDPVEKEITEITWSADSAQKDGYEHFMLKEIHEQPRAVADTISSVIKNGEIDLSLCGLTKEKMSEIKRLHLIGCGSAYHTAQVAKYVFESMANIPVNVDIASEFRYRDPILSEDELVIVVSQSGETADSLAALRLSKEKGVMTMGIVNVVGSSIERESDFVFRTLAGPEIAVATTKAYSAQLAAFYCLAVAFSQARGTITENEYKELVAQLESLPEKIKLCLENKERLQKLSSKLANSQSVFFIGRGIDSAVCLEGSLKMKEISYIHCEAYPAGELKHGTISLIEEGTPVIGILTQPSLYEKTLSNMIECKSRGAYLIGLSSFEKGESEKAFDFSISVPEINHYFQPSLAAIPLQLLAYYISVSKGLDVDKPRNLAKSVTVE